MNETGANIGFIISKYGLQSGAGQYTQNTNIVGLTYLELQQRYFEAWWRRYFCPRIGDAADRVFRYVEDFNPKRDEAYASLTDDRKEVFDRLRSHYMVGIGLLSMLNAHTVCPNLDMGGLLDVPSSLESFKEEVLSKGFPGVEWHCSSFRELLNSILQFLRDVETEFNYLFDGYIFDIEPLSGVEPDGPPIDSQ